MRKFFSVCYDLRVRVDATVEMTKDGYILVMQLSHNGELVRSKAIPLSEDQTIKEIENMGRQAANDLLNDLFQEVAS